MKTLDQQLSDLLLEIYASATTPSHWDLVLKKIAEEVEATKASMHMHQFSRQKWEAHKAGSRLHSFGYDVPSADDYARRFAHLDPYVLRIRKRYRHSGVGTSDDLLTVAELKKTEFYNEYGRKNGIFFVSWAVVEQNDRFASGLAVIRPEDGDQFAPGQVELLKLLTPHLENSFHIQRQLDSALASNEALLRSVAQLGIAVIALDGERRIINLSDPARAIVYKKDAIRVCKQRLEATHVADDEALQQALKTTARPWENPLGVRTHALRLTGKSGGGNLQAIVFPFTPSLASLSTSAVPFGDDRPRVLVILSDPSSKPLPREAVLRLLYKLTDAEARFADLLLQGYVVKEAAELAKVTEGTARERLNQIFAKTGTCRQAELMRLMLSLPGLPLE